MPVPKNDSSFAWKQIAEKVEPFLKAVASSMEAQVKEFEPEIASFAHYALSAQGKQLRSLLVCLSGEATGQVTEAHVRVAAIIEMVHLATLVHDDVMDSANLRRGRPTLAAHWGNEISVLLGDCLFAHSLKLAASFPTTEICRAVASATNTVCSGEILQTQRRRNFKVTRQEYFKILQMKTGELFALACDLGAYLAESTPTQRQALRGYGMALGTAYQIYDDCVDLFGSEEVVGKSLGTDLAQGKLTLPILLTLERAEHQEVLQLKESIEHWKPEHMAWVLSLMARWDIWKASRAILQEHLEEARHCLNQVPEGEGRTRLLGLIDYLGLQTDRLESDSSLVYR